jgi:hypothetical protein
MRRWVTLSVAGLAVVFALSYAIPAIGGPQAFSSASPVKLAKKALKTGKKANKRARKAQGTANRALGAITRNGGVLGANVQTVASPPVPIAAGTISSGTISCPAGAVVISGGYSLTGGEASAIFDHKSGNGWSVGVDNLAAAVGAGGTGETATVVVEAQCATTATATTSTSSARADRARDARLIDAARAAARR